MDLTNRLSKSRYVKGLRCMRALYLSVHHYGLGTPPTEAQQARFDAGHRVGELAQQRYPEGVLIAEDHFRHAEAVESTRRAIAGGVPAIFEAAFAHDNVKVRVDVLRRLDGGGFELIEVKSTGSYQPDKHLADAAIQLHVLLGSGIDVRCVSLMHLNREYVYPGGEHDPLEALTATDITDEAFAYLADVPGHLARMMDTLALSDVPDAPEGVSCERPYECEFLSWCTRDVPEPDLSGEVVTDPAVMRRLEGLPFPLYFVDFETINPALPVFPGTSPFQVAKVQWSVHSLHADGTLEHAEFLVRDASTDPSSEFMETLFDALGHTGTFVHYGTYERTALVDIALRNPEWRQPLVDRIPGFYDALARKLAEHGVSYADLQRPSDSGLVAFDLGMRIVRPGCTHPVFGENGWSIKRAIQVLAPDLPPYAALVVSDGEQSMSATEEMLAHDTPREHAARIRADLLEYCKQDTLAMVEIYRGLAQRHITR